MSDSMTAFPWIGVYKQATANKRKANADKGMETNVCKQMQTSECKQASANKQMQASQ